jgi:hypothetical protein
MKDFKQLQQEAKDKHRPEPNFFGTFQCQWCDEIVYEQFYNPTKQVVVWWCSKDHESGLEEFHI